MGRPQIFNQPGSLLDDPGASHPIIIALMSQKGRRKKCPNWLRMYSKPLGLSGVAPGHSCWNRDQQSVSVLLGPQMAGSSARCKNLWNMFLVNMGKFSLLQKFSRACQPVRQHCLLRSKARPDNMCTMHAGIAKAIYTNPHRDIMIKRRVSLYFPMFKTIYFVFIHKDNN